MSNFGKRTLAVLLAVALTLSNFPDAFFSAISGISFSSEITVEGETESDSGNTGTSSNNAGTTSGNEVETETETEEETSVAEETEEETEEAGIMLTAQSTDSLQTLINAATSTTSTIITLQDDYEGDLIINDGVNVTINLNGHTITSGGTNKNAITVYGTLILTDESTSANGELKNGDGVTARGVDVAQGGSFTLKGGTITGFSASGNGGGVLVEKGGTFVMSGGTIDNNSATGYGGGVFLYEADQIADMTAGTISNNTSGLSGGGLAANIASGSEITLGSGLTISGNTAATYGGGVYFNNTLTKLTINSNISGNTATSDAGGGVYFGASVTEVNIVNSTISGNTSGGAGGGAYFGASVSTLIISGSTIDGNASGAAGGGAYFAVNVPSATVTDSSISDNEAAGYGGGLWFTAGTGLTLENSKVNSNVVYAEGKLYGGGIYLSSSNGSRSTFSISDSEMSGNTLTSSDSSDAYGGAIYIGQYATVSFTDSTFSSNSGASYGGAIYVDGNGQGDIPLTNLTVSDNSALTSATKETGRGGGVYIANFANDSGYVVTISGGTYSGNYADFQGGAVFIVPTLTVKDSAVFEDNESYSNGGAILAYTQIIIEGGDTESETVKICNNRTQNGVGGGVYANSATEYALTATGYVLVSGNKAQSTSGNGGGLCSGAGGMYLAGNVTISGNSSNGNYGGGGIYGSSTATGSTIYLASGVEICNNTSTTSGGGVYGRNNVYIEDGVSIHDNEATSGGGGVYGLSITMEGGEVYNNSAANGGGIYDGNGTSDDSHYSGGKIYNNTAKTGNGGGIGMGSSANIIYIEGDIEIYGNSAPKGSGGGILATHELYITGGSIHDNTALRGGGLFLYGYKGQSATVQIAQGSEGIIYNNKATSVNYGNDVALTTVNSASVTGATTSYTSLYMDMASSFTDTANGITGTYWYDELNNEYIDDEIDVTNASGASYYTFVYKTDDTVAKVLDKTTGTYVEFSTVQEAVTAVANNDTNGTTYDNEIIMIDDSREDVTIPDGVVVTLDLAGHTLKGMAASTITVESGAVLTIEDSSDDGSGNGTGLITGGSGNHGASFLSSTDTSTSGGGLFISGTAILNGGTISGNKATYGAGVCADLTGTFTMNGGSIESNAGTSGGGVYLRSSSYNASNIKFTMTGGSITGNTATNGAGIYPYYSVVEISGGSITGNTATTYGGAIYAYARGGVYITDTEITGNTAATGGGIYIQTSTSVLSVGTGSKLYGNTATTNNGNDIYATVSNASTGNIGSISLLAASDMGNSSYTSWLDSNADGSDTYPYYYTDALSYGGASVKNHVFYLTATSYSGGYVAYIRCDTLTSDDTVYQYTTTDGEGNTVYSYTMDDSAISGTPTESANGTAYSTLQGAINAATSGDTIYLLCDVEESLSLSAKTIAIDLNGYTISSVSDYGFNITRSGDVSTELTLCDTSTDVFHNTEAGAEGTLTVASSNKSSFPRGIYMASSNISYPSSLTVDGVLITGFGNDEMATSSGTSSYYGGGIYALNYNKVVIKGGSTFTDNYAYYGGAVFISGPNVTLTIEDGAVFSSNGAYVAGGIYFNFNTTSSTSGTNEYWGKCTIGAAEITGNTAYKGGGIYISGWNNSLNESTGSWPEVNLTGTIISGNSATNEAGGFYMIYVTNATFTDCKITGNTSSGTNAGMEIAASGTNILHNAVINITDCEFTDNTAVTNYAGLSVSYGTLNISGCTFTGNTAATNVSALYLNAVKNLTVDGCTFTGNKSTTNGYIVQISNCGEVSVKDTKVIGNTTATAAGAVHVTNTNESTSTSKVHEYDSNITFSGCTISNNTGYGLEEYMQDIVYNLNVTLSDSNTISENDNYGVYVHGYGSTTYFVLRDHIILNIEEGTVISNNKSSGVNLYYCTLNMSGGEICNNTTTASGGGILSQYSNVNISGGSIHDNTATSHGGGMYLQENANTYGVGDNDYTASVETDIISGGSIYGNTAVYGGGIFITDYNKLEMTGGSITDNTASTYGGGVYLDDIYSSFVMDAGQIYDNSATLGQDVYTTYNSTYANTTLQLIAAENMFDSSADKSGIGWLNESLETVTTTSIDYDPVKKVYPLTLEYETNTVVAVIYNADTGSYDPFTSVQYAVNALQTDKTDGTGIYYTNAITSPEIILVDDALGNVEITGGLTLTLNLNGYTLKGNTTAITCYGTMTIVDEATSPGTYNAGTSTGTITGTSALTGGGVVVYSGGSVTMTSGQIANCTAGGTTSSSGSYGGAGVYIKNGSFVLGGTASINNCSTKSYGGAVYLTGTSGTFTLQDNAVIENNSAQYGAGVYLTSGTFKMTGGSINNNSVTVYGGGVFVNSGTAKITGGTISENSATNRGGGVYVNSGTVTLSGSALITGNCTTAALSTSDVLVGAGGGVYVNGGTLNIKTGSKITGNSSVRGAGVYQYSGTINMTGGQITKNTAEYGGGLVQYPTQSGIFKMTGGVLCDNTSNLSSAGNDVYSVSESGYEYTGSSYPTATLVRAADMDYKDEGYSASYNVWKDDGYTESNRTGSYVGAGQYITEKITSSYNLMLTADVYGNTTSTTTASTTFYAKNIAIASIKDGTTSTWDTTNGDVTLYKDASGTTSTSYKWDATSPTSPVAAEWTAGNDSGNNNGLVRSYDSITYSLSVAYEDSDGSDTESDTLLLYVEATLPVSTTYAEFSTTTNLKDAVIEEGDDGESSTITGYLEVASEIGFESVSITVKVNGMDNGSLVQPTFKSWMDGNSSTTNLASVTAPAVTVSAAGMYDVTLLRNTELSYTGYFDLNTGEETTKDAYLLAQAAGDPSIVYGTMLGYGLTLSMRNSSTSKGKMGMASPTGDIEFDLTLKGSLYIDNTVVTDVNGDQVYAAPYVWAYKANENTETGSNLDNTLRSVNMNWNDEDDTSSTTQYAYNAAPFNTGGNSTSCYSGGAWTATGDQPASDATETTVHFTVSGYTIDTAYSNTNPSAASDGSTDNFTGSYIKAFSAGYIQVIFPIDTDAVSGQSGYLSVGMESIVSDLSISDAGGNAASSSSASDLATFISWYGSSDYTSHATCEVTYANNYTSEQTGLYVSSGEGENLTKTNYFNNSSNGTLSSSKGNATTALGSVVYMGSDVTFTSTTYDTTDSTSVRFNDEFDVQEDNAIEYDYMTAMNLLQKFDAKAYTPASTTLEVVNETYTLTKQTNDITDKTTGETIFRIKTSEAAASWSSSKTMSYTLTILYAAKPDGENWVYHEYYGYESPVEEMDATTEEDLIYFTTLQDLYDYFGYNEDGTSKGVCVGILYEFRDCCIRTGRSISVTARLDVTNEFENAGKTFCITNDARCWTTFRPVYKDALDSTKNVSLEDQLFSFSWYSENGETEYGTENGVTAYGTATGSYPSSYDTAYAKYSNSDGGYEYKGNAKIETYNNGYIKTEYVNGYMDTTTPTHGGGWYSGNTLLLYTLVSDIDITVADKDEDSNVPKSVYDIGTERTAKFTVTPTLAESSSVSNELVSNGTQSTEVVITISLPNHLNFDEDSLTFDYSAADCGYEDGELLWNIVYTESDAAVGEDGYGTATLVLTTSVSDISKKLPTINYSCTIGDPTVSDGHPDEVTDGEKLTTDVSINTTYEESGQISTYAKDDSVTISVAKTGGDNLWIEGSGLLELGESMEFDIYYKNGSNSYRSVEIGNVLPYNGDGRGTNFTGGYQVTGLTLTFASEATMTAFLNYGALIFDTGVEYSDDSDDQVALLSSLLSSGYVLYAGSGASTYLTGISTSTVGNSSTYMTSSDPTSGTYTITFDLTKLDATYQELLTQLATTQTNGVNTGIAFYTYLNGVASGEVVEMSYTLSPAVTVNGSTSLIMDGNGEVQTGQNEYVESVFYQLASAAGGSTGSVTSLLRSVYNLERVLSGIAWLDQDNDGYYSTGTDSTDKLLTGIDVYLYSTVPTDEQDSYNDQTVTVNKDAGSGEITSVQQEIDDGNGYTTTITLYPTTLTLSDGTTVKLYPAVSIEGNLYDKQITGTDGKYSFDWLASGYYYVVFQDDSDDYTVEDTGSAPLPFGQLSVTSSPVASTSAGAYNFATASYGGNSSTADGPASLVLGYISIYMPTKSEITTSGNTYTLGNRNAGFYYRELTVQKVWQNMVLEVNAGTEVEVTVTGTSKGASAYTYENTYEMKQVEKTTGLTVVDPNTGEVSATSGTITATNTSSESSYAYSGISLTPGTGTQAASTSTRYYMPSLTVSEVYDSGTGVNTITWTLGTIALQAEDESGVITYSLGTGGVVETEEVDNGQGGTTTQTLTGYVLETNYAETKNSTTSPTVITAKASNTQVLYELDLYKISSSSAYLANAQFTLYSDADCTNVVTAVSNSASGESGSEAGVSGTGSTEDYGKLTIGQIAAGTYYLKETVAPTGYELNQSVWKIDIEYVAATPTTPNITVTLIKDKDGNPTDTNLKVESGSGTGTTATVYLNPVAGSDSEYTLSFQIVNELNYSMPSIGSVGIGWTTLGGIALMLFAVWVLLRDREKRDRGMRCEEK